MPIYDYAIQPDARANSQIYLKIVGPLIDVEISAPDSLIQFLQTSHKPMPQPESGYGIIDTGAVTSCVNKSVLQGLGGQPVGNRPFSTAGANVNLDVYPAKIKFPGTTINRTFDVAVGIADMNLLFRGKRIIALIGRDVLTDCVLIYNGKTGIYTLTH